MLDTTVIFKLRSQDKEEAEEIIKASGDTYTNLSHFARVAFLKLLRESRKD